MFIQASMGCRLPAELARCGFEVGALCTPAHALSYTRFVKRRYTLEFPARRDGIEAAVLEAMIDWRPSLIVPCDDISVWFLHDALTRRRDDPAWASALPVLRASLCDPDDFETVERKSCLPALAGRAGVQTPETVLHENVADTIAWAEAHDFQAVVKSDYTAGGNGVSICRSREDVRSALSRVIDGRETSGRVSRKSVQKIVHGRSCCVVGVARGGRTLAQFSFTPETSKDAVSPSCVIRQFSSEALDDAARRLVQACRYSGFFAIDFIACRETGRMDVIDFNARVSQSTHLGRSMGGDLCEALRRSVAPGGEPRADPPRPADVIALFPFEWRRDPESPYLTSSYHDVPWADPHLLNKLIAG